MIRWRPVAAIVVVIVAVDQLTKTWALNTLGDGRVIDVVWTLRFNLAFNTGMAFSRGPGLGPVIGVLSLVIVVAVVMGLRRQRSWWRVVPGSAVVGGALGNIIDRLFRDEGFMRGAVVDFIDFQWWPIFNVADMAIVTGGIALVYGLSRQAAT
jgi:signal peptidase II